FFAGTAGVLQQDNTNFFWDDTNNRLGIGTATPSEVLHVVGSVILGQTGAGNGRIYVDYSGGNYYDADQQFFRNINSTTTFLTLGPTDSAFNTGKVGIGDTSPDAQLDLVQAVNTSGSPSALIVEGGAHTTLTASTEATDINFNLARTVQFDTGALTTQRAMRIQAPTYSFVGASTITTASTLSISGPPVAGTNATLTNKYAVNVETGDVKITDGNLTIASTEGAGVTARGNLNLRGTLLMTSKDNYFTNKIQFGTTATLHAINANAMGWGTSTTINGWYTGGTGFFWKKSATQYYGWSRTDYPYGGAYGFTSTVNDIVDQRSGTNAQSLQIYNTYTSSTNYERGVIDWQTTANTLRIGTEKGSAGGTARDLAFVTDATARVTIGATSGNVGINTSSGGTDCAYCLAIAGSTAPSASITDGIQLFAVDIAGSHELRVRDEAGNVTTLSPHNFSLFTPEQDYYLPWAYTSERDNQAINVDMYGAIQQVELLSGKHFIYGKNLETNEEFHPTKLTDAGILANLEARILKLETTQSTAGTEPSLTELLPAKDGEIDDSTTIQTLKLTQEEFDTLFIATLKTTTALHIYQDIIIDGNAKVAGTLTRGNEKVGTSIIPAHATKVRVTFDEVFLGAETPILVTVTPNGNLGSYWVNNQESDGFTVNLKKVRDVNVVVTWVALQQKNSASSVKVLEQEVALVEEEPTEEPEAEPSPEEDASPNQTSPSSDGLGQAEEETIVDEPVDTPV
ncbi:MAG: hypothetical protein O3A36_02710, partial [bacterium]|nr:hypothetical protein [bacterium]